MQCEGRDVEGAFHRILVVDDYELWQGFVSKTLRNEPELQIIGQVWDGLEAVQKAQELRPDLILLDIGLPTLNGIEAAHRMREVSPTSKILFVSENRSLDIARGALSTGARGYVVKSDAAGDLLPAIRAVLKDEQFVSSSLVGRDLAEASDDQNDNPQRNNVGTPFQAQKKVRHEVEFYADDAGFVHGFARFIEAALKAGDAVIVVATESHQAQLHERLTADGVNVVAESEQGSYIPLSVTDTLSSFMVNGAPDPVLFGKLAGDLITQAAKGAKGQDPRVAVCGEAVHTLLAAGNLEATIKLEHMWDEITRRAEVDVLCGYFQSTFASGESISTLNRVCAEHSAAHGRELCVSLG